MPELAEVEAYRRLWDCGRGQAVRRVRLHPAVRIFRSTDPFALGSLAGSRLLQSEARGKLMLFSFSRQKWMSIHLGMSGRLRVESPGFQPSRHDHLVLYQRQRALVLTDPRQFGAVRFHVGKAPPDWWQALPPAVLSKQFSVEAMADFLRRHGRLPIKGALLLQSGFPGVGNWMADEILWQAQVHPKLLTRRLSEGAVRELWRRTRMVCKLALESIAGPDVEPPKGWLIHERWSGQGRCPRHKTKLQRAPIAGRTSAWCAKCQGA